MGSETEAPWQLLGKRMKFALAQGSKNTQMPTREKEFHSSIFAPPTPRLAR